jgi:fatty acid desaturase
MCAQRIEKPLLEGQRYCLYRRNSILRETLVHILDVHARQERKFGQSLYICNCFVLLYFRSVYFLMYFVCLYSVVLRQVIVNILKN